MVGSGGIDVQSLRDYRTLLLPASDGQILDALGKLALIKRLKLAEETIQSLLDAVRSVERLAQGPIAHSCLVEVELYEEDLPDVTAFDPPPITESI